MVLNPRKSSQTLSSESFLLRSEHDHRTVLRIVIQRKQMVNFLFLKMSTSEFVVNMFTCTYCQDYP